MKPRKLLLWGVPLIVLMVCGYWAARLLWLRPFQIEHFFERAYIEFLWDDPEALTSTGILKSYGLDGYSHLLTDASPRRALQLADIGRRNLNILEGYDRERLAPEEQVSYDVLHWFLSSGVDGEPFLFHDYPVTHLSGPHIELPQFMTQTHAIKCADDAANYLRRLAGFGSKFGQAIDALAYRKDLGIIAPTFILEKAMRQCDEFVAMTPDENPLYTSFVSRVENMQDMSDERKQKLSDDCRSHIIDHVYPAYKRLSGYLMQLQPFSMSIAGTWQLPDGDAYYRHCLQQQTTLDLDPEELYELGKQEMSRLEGEIRILLNLLRYPEDMSVNEILREFNNDHTITFRTDSVGRAACLAHFKRTVDIVRPRLSKYFDHLPQAALEVHELPEYRKEGAPLAFYLPPKGDPLGPGRLFVNTWKADHLPYFLATSYAYHEGIPGHHLQKAIQVELNDIPKFRRFLPFTAFTEGWAMYAEEIGHEIISTEDPLDRLGALQSDLFRTARLVTDVGIHHKKWLREQAVTFMMDHAGLSHDEAQDEVDRYIVWPGQGCAYKVGKMEFMQLRDRARNELGHGFDDREFHSMLIGSGSMPLKVLDAQVDKWIQSRSLSSN